MATKILIPTPLRPYTGRQESVEVEGRTVGELLGELTRRHEGLKAHLFTEQGRLRNFVNVYVNDEDIRRLQKEQTPVAPGDVLSIVPSVAGGVDTTTVAGLPTLTNDEIRRYSRHLLLPEVGIDGQRKLKAARVLCVGAGGLGSPVAIYLAAAGVGTLGLVDFDTVDYSNLQRQILHSTPDVGRSKLESATRRLSALNPEVNVETHEVSLTSANALPILERYDYVIDGTDNFPTRYLVNDACVLLRKPNIYGSVFRFEGQASVFATGEGPCYRCLYPEPPPPGVVPSCAEGGVLGVLPGLIGTIQATETIKLIIGAGTPLIGRLLLFDALAMRLREVRLRKDPECPMCGTHPTIHELIDYDQFCGVRHGPAAVNEEDMTPRELKAWLDAGGQPLLLDVREPQEYAINRLPGGFLIPMSDLPGRVGELDPARSVVVYCKVGERSARAVQFLRGLGFRDVRNLTGGVRRWVDEVDPSQPSY